MVRKTVSKKSSKSYISRDDKNNMFAPVKDDSAETENKPGAELLNIPAPNNGDNDARNSGTQSEPPKAPAFSALGSSTPMFMDDITHLDTTVQKSESQLPKILAIIICMIILIFWVTVVILSTHINFGPKMMDKNITYTTYVPINNSFKDIKLNNMYSVNLMNITDIGYSQKVILQGFLREEVVQKDPNTKITTEYIVDDYGNKIKLQFGVSQRENDYKKLFVINNNTRGTYNVTGTYLYYNREFLINNIENISAQPKGLNIITKMQIQNVVVESSGIKFDLNSGWTTVNELVFGKQVIPDQE